MVTLAEFVRHMVTAAVVMGVGFGAITFSRFRYDTAHRSFRRFAWWYAGLLALIGLLSWMSSVRTIRCPRDPSEFCRFNDSVPAMGTVVLIYTITALIRARSMYNKR